VLSALSAWNGFAMDAPSAGFLPTLNAGAGDAGRRQGNKWDYVISGVGPACGALTEEKINRSVLFDDLFDKAITKCGQNIFCNTTDVSWRHPTREETAS
jgi:hypothetical protein